MQFDVPKSPQYYTKDLSDFLGVDFTSIAPNEHRASNLINLVNNDGYLETRPGYNEVLSFGERAHVDFSTNGVTITWTAFRAGAMGNNYSVTFIKPTKRNQKLKMTEENGEVIYYLATDGYGNVTTTVQDIFDMPNHYVWGSCNSPQTVVAAHNKVMMANGVDHRINGVWNYDEDVTNIFLVHVEDKLYKVSEDFQTKTLISSVSNLNDNRSEAVFMNNKLLIFDGKRVIVYGKLSGDVYSAGYADQYGTVPTTSVNRKPNGTGASSQYYESPNLFSAYRINSFVADGTSTTYYVEAPFDNERPTAQVLNPNTGLKETINVSSFDRTTGKVVLASAPPIFPVTGRDSVFIKFKLSHPVDRNQDLINKCTIVTTYGYDSNPNRIFCAGNPDYPNVDWFSGLSTDGADPLYFPDDNFTMIGTQPIVAYSKLNDGSLAIQKATSDTDYTCFYRHSALYNGKEVFPIRMGVKTLGCITKNANANLVNDPLTLTEMGVYGIKGSSYGEKFQMERSYFVKRKLLKEPNLENAVAIVHANKYYLAINNHVYVADQRFRSRVSQANSSDFQYEWYYWENIPVRGWFTFEDELYFYTTSGDICKFNDTCLDYNFPIECLFDTAFLDLGTLAYAKTVKRVTVVTRPYDDGEYTLSYQTVDGDQDITVKETKENNFLSTLQEKEKIKKCMFVKFRLSNNTEKKMNFYRLAILYIIAGRYRGN